MSVVPGVTSAVSVPALAGIPLTHRGVATSFTVATAHDQLLPLGGGRDHTVVLLMGVGTLAQSALTLARGERGGDCPVAIVEDGFGARQRVTVGTLATIAAQAAERGVRSPAVVVVGDVVRLSPYAPAALASLDLTFDPLARSPKGPFAVTSSSLTSLRVAIVGAGPAGIYAGNILTRAVTDAGGTVAIDLFDSLPAPYGLIRYGVAPDHPRIKGIVDSLHEMLDTGSTRFIGNVEVGRDIAVDELHSRYDAVILATGALRDAPLDIPGIDLPGSYGAADFVAWYDGHPDVPREWPLDEREVAVIGNGNVALDIARVLAKHAVDLRSTEIADNVLHGLEASAVTDVHVFGRRGPADIKFTPIELRELGEVPNVDIVVHDEDFADADPSQASNNQLKVMLRVLNSWRTREQTGASRRLHLHFYHSPLAVLGDERVEGLRFERTEPAGDGTVRGTGEIREIAVQQVYRAVGYFSSPVLGAPFDAVRGVVANVEGRVVEGSEVVSGLYATGWIKRGPVGLIGHTKSDAMETIAHLVSDIEAGALSAPTVDGDVLEALAERGVEFTTWEGWRTLDAHERALGAAHEHTRERVKVVSREEQVSHLAVGGLRLMTYVIALPCVDVKDRACIDECPVDCIYEGERSLYIHPDECVDCGACEPVCPVEAIYYEDDLPEEWPDYYKANVEFFDDIGSPGGAAKVGVIAKDHPVVAVLPPQAHE